MFSQCFVLQGAYERARKVLVTHQHELHALAGELLEKETLSGDQIKELITQVGGCVRITQ
jgi:ATP-dependent metalloprotease